MNLALPWHGRCTFTQAHTIACLRWQPCDSGSRKSLHRTRALSIEDTIQIDFSSHTAYGYICSELNIATTPAHGLTGHAPLTASLPPRPRLTATEAHAGSISVWRHAEPGRQTHLVRASLVPDGGDLPAEELRATAVEQLLLVGEDNALVLGVCEHGEDLVIRLGLEDGHAIERRRAGRGTHCEREIARQRCVEVELCGAVIKQEGV